MEKMEELEEKEQELAKSQCGKDKLLQEDNVLCEQVEQIVFPSDLIRAKNNFRDPSDLFL